MIAHSEMTAEQARTLVQRCFYDLILETEKVGGFVPVTSEPDLEMIEQLCLSNERIEHLNHQVAFSEFDGTVKTRARLVANASGVTLEALATPMQTSFMSGIARALIEQQRLYQLRAEDRLSAYQPSDPLFRPAHAAIEQIAAANPEPRPRGLTTGEAVVSYLSAGKARWVKKTHQARVWQLCFLVEHVGADLPLGSVTSDHVRTFRDAVRTLHRLHGKKVGCSFVARQTDNSDHWITDKTAAIIFEPVKAFFRWAKSDEGLITTNPAQDVRLVAAKKVKGVKTRRPFAADELATLFSAPVFRGCRSVHRRYEPGKRLIKDAKFWIPILGLYSGARLGELIQLHVRDVDLDGPVPYLSINEDNLPDSDPANRKHVKSAAGIRRVPIHPDVIALGFSDFDRRKAIQIGKGRVRLFAEFAYGSDGQASTVASKWFARFMDSVGLTDPQLVFHSFRHNAEDAFRNALVPQYVIDQIIGHSDGTTSSGYGEGVDLATALEAVKGMKLRIRLAEFWRRNGV